MNVDDNGDVMTLIAVIYHDDKILSYKGPTIYVWEIEQQQGMNGILRSSLTRILRSSSILLEHSGCKA